MKKAILFGAGTMGKRFYEQLKDQYEIICATDNDEKKYGQELAPGILIKDKAVLRAGGFDCVIITTYAGFEEVYTQLVTEFGLSDNKIVSRYVEPTIRAKITFLKSFAKIVRAKGIRGNICEAGVYRGGFAKHMNQCFPNRKIYLFDTFEGYDKHDINVESEMKAGGQIFEPGSLAMTSEELVLSVMSNPSQCIIKKGWFPETFDLYDEEFCFVNIDLDLYRPTKAALELFYPRMAKGGVILLHDYLFDNMDSVTRATDEFTQERGLGIVPIGDGVSVLIIKNF